MSEPESRIKVWNSFLKLARDGVLNCQMIVDGKEYDKDFEFLGGTLPEDQHHVLAALLMCNLAVEARVNHLIEEFVEDKLISAEVGDAARRLPTKQKWFLLPTLAGKSSTLKSSSGPHQAVAQICDIRNDLMHVQFTNIIDRLPSAETMVSYFQRFIEAMEDMNVILGRISKARQEVVAIGEINRSLTDS